MNGAMASLGFGFGLDDRDKMIQRLLEENRKLSDEKAGVEEKLQSCANETRELKRKIATYEADLGARDRTIKDLCEETRKLRARAPLVEIGVDIRKRFMEQEVPYDLKSFRSQDNIEAGNCAAHEGDEEADLAMIEDEDLLSPDEREQARAMFSYIYERSSDEESAGEEYGSEESDEGDSEESDDDEQYGYNENYAQPGYYY